MPRSMAPPPSGEFTIRLNKPFEGKPTQTIEVIGEPNRPASIRQSQYEGSTKSSEKAGDVPKDDVVELMTLVNQLRGFPSHMTKDVYGLNVYFELNTFEIQWANKDEDPTANEVSEIAPEQKQTFKDVVESFEALARTFAKHDSAI
ncbi:hypothetical protein WHR41_04160 [Cladosporium halotolerans]|uniref:Uncharacterized protein n=1 Tax=Cladosporium halotolerans TaxID=1052096 RepID=A0AB34KUL3_9PEZI